MSKPNNYSKAVWLPLIFITAWINLSTSIATAQQIQWRQDLAKAKAEARDTNRLVWLHFTADWCIPCKRIETFVFSSTGVIRAADRNTVAVNIDADVHESLVKQLEVPRIPYDVIMTPSGRVILDRASPEDITSFLAMLDSLDRPLQELTDSDREVINARIDKLHSIVDQSKGLRQKRSDLDLDKPSHQMAPTTVQGQRLERGFESATRVAEIRATEAQLFKKKAENYIAEQERLKNGEQTPKVSNNPFFNPSDSAAKITLPHPGNASPFEINNNKPKTLTNKFVRQDPTINPNQNFTLPLPPTFGQKATGTDGKDLNAFQERKEFSFAATNKPIANLTSPNSTQPKLAQLESSTPKPPKFKDGSGKKTDDNDFAYAPIDKLRQTLRTAAKPISNSFKKPDDNSFPGSTAKSPKLEMPAQQTSRTKLAWNQPKPAVKKQAETFAEFEFERPAMKTAVSIPKPPVMVEGVVRIAETRSSAIEGRLVAAEQPLDEGSLVRTGQAQDTIKKQLSRTDRLLEGVNFFANQNNDRPKQSTPNTFAVPGQPVSQPQIVINLNAGTPTTTPPAQAANPSVVIQPNFSASNRPTQVAQVSNTAAVSRARITTADIAAAARSKYALKGKCPVTLMSEGRWADGNKEIGCVHRDRVYLFATASHREAFLANPDKLSPLLAGFDPVIFEETGKLIEGEEKFGTFMGKKPNQRIVLFKTADTRERFQKEPSKYLSIVRQAMAGSVPKDIKVR